MYKRNEKPGVTVHAFKPSALGGSEFKASLVYTESVPGQPRLNKTKQKTTKTEPKPNQKRKRKGKVYSFS